MKKKNTLKLLLLLLSNTLLFISCSNDLSRGAAEKIIREQKGFPIIQYTTIDLRFADQNHNGLPERYIKMQEGGLISVNKEESVKNQYSGMPETVYTIALTDLGKKYEIKPEQYNESMKNTEDSRNAYTYYVPYTIVKTYELDFGNIIDLQKTTEFETVANYDTKITNQTPFFEINNEDSKRMGGTGAQAYRDHKVFRKYDDGWK